MKKLLIIFLEAGINFGSSVSAYPPARHAGMLTGAAFVGVHMALTHGVTLGMVASYIPATEIKGIGRITGTCWSFTDFVFGESADARQPPPWSC